MGEFEGHCPQGLRIFLLLPISGKQIQKALEGGQNLFMNSAKIAVLSFLEVDISVYSIKYLFLYWKESYWPIKNSDSETSIYLSRLVMCRKAP